jgi:hypothetical protein
MLKFFVSSQLIIQHVLLQNVDIPPEKVCFLSRNVNQNKAKFFTYFDNFTPLNQNGW